MKIKNIINYLEEIAPLEYQESYDNSGLIIGNQDVEVKGTLIALDCTEEVIEEAITKDCNLIIVHHPIVFSGIKKFNGSNYIERIVIKAIKNDLAIYAIHTNIDNVLHGVNGKIADKLKLENRRILAPKSDILRQLVVYCPMENVKTLKESLFSAGAGEIGNYKNCSFSSIGKGTFKATCEANPSIGKIGKLHVENEERIEVIYSINKEREVLDTMQKNHPYEEVAYQIYLINNNNQLVGSGLVGELAQPIQSEKFLSLVKKTMSVKNIRCTALVKNKIKKVAVCGGSGSFLLQKAKSVGADIFITSDFKYHQFFDADREIIIADIGHYESEQYTKELIYELLSKKFTKFAVQLSNVNTNPINYI